MNNYYISFGSNCNLRDSLMVIEADSKEEARKKFITTHSHRFCSCYDEEEKEDYCKKWPTTIVDINTHIEYYD